MASNKSRRGTGNLLQDLLSSVIRLKKCDKQITSTNSVKSELKIKLQFTHCFICGVKHQRRPLSELKVESLREIIRKESFHESISTTSICPLCSTTLDKLIDLRKKVDEISACIRSVIKLRHSLGLADLEDIEIRNSTTEIIYNVKLNDDDKDSSVGVRNGEADDDDAEENLTCPECNVTFEKSWQLNRHQRNPWLDRSGRQYNRPDFTYKETNAQDFEELDSPNVSTNVDTTTADSEDFKKCKSDISDYDCVPIDDLILEVVEESIKGSEDEKVVDLDGVSDLISNYDGKFILDLTPELPLALPEIKDLAVHLDGGSEPINNLIGEVIGDMPELPLEEIDGEDDGGVDIEEFVQCKAEDELMIIHDPALNVVRETSRGLQIAKVKNEDGEEVKLFTNLDGVYDIVSDFGSHAAIVQSIEPPTLENLTCPECNVTFNKSWKLNRHLRNPWLTRSPQENKKRSRSISNDEQEADLQINAKRPRLSRIRAEKLIKNMTNRVNLKNDDNDDPEDSDFNVSSDSLASDEVESSSDDESIDGEDNNNLSRPELSFDDAELCTETGRYKCLKCNTTYGSKYDLRRHLETTFAHTGRNPPQRRRHHRARTVIPNKSKKKCEICDHAFSRSEGLQTHLESQKHAVALRYRKINDDGVVTFRCDKCDQVEFPDSHGIFEHVHKIHNSYLGPIEEELATLQCAICCENFGDLPTLIKHKGLHGKKCGLCNLNFRRPHELVVHVETKNHKSAVLARRVHSDGNVTFLCDRCPNEEQYFPDVAQLIKHKKNYHSRPRIFADGKSCRPCDKIFTSRRSYNRHLLSNLHTTTVGGVTLEQILMPTQDEIASLKCTICAVTFNNEAALTKHKSTHGKKCEICDLEFSSAIRLGRHLQFEKHAVALRCRRLSADGVVTFSCYKCDHVEFPDLLGIFNHVTKLHQSGPDLNFDDTEICMKSRKFKCLQCNVTFSSKQILRNHLTTFAHTGRNPPNNLPGISIPTRSELETLQCTICAMTFNDVQILTKHKSTHDKKCDVCDLMFDGKKELRLHLETPKHRVALRCRKLNEDDVVAFSCDKCDEVEFPNLLGIFQHMKTIHNSRLDDTDLCTESEIYKCLECNTTYSSKIALEIHLTRTFAHNGRTPRRHRVRTLAPTQNEIATLQCTICAGTFDDVETLTEHKSTHDKKCDVCELMFDGKKELRLHLETPKHLVALRCRKLNEDGVVAFSCDKCDQVEFPNLPGIFQHMKTIHKSWLRFSRLDDTELCTESEIYKCLECNTTYSSKNSLEYHLRTTYVHNGRKRRRHRVRTSVPTQNEIATLKCTVCAGTFDDVETLTKHKLMHDKKCDICDLKFSTQKELRLHLETQNHGIALRCRKLNADGVATFSCDQCDQIEFPNIFELLQHKQQTHDQISSCAATEEEIATLQCTICSDKFDDFATLVKHKALHGYKCDVCERDLSNSSKFGVHRQSKYHQLAVLARRVDSNGKVSFVCDRCPKVGPFPNYQKLVDHRKKYHPGRNTFVEGTTPVKSCLPCDQGFYSVEAYKLHLATTRHADRIGAKEASPLDFACNQCDRKFAVNFLLSKHLADFHGQDVVCEICGMWFRNLARLTSHQKTHVNPPKSRQRYIPPEDKPYPCKFCDKRFTRSCTRNAHVDYAHLRKRCKCDLCLGTFATLLSLAHHKKRVHKVGNCQLPRKTQPKCNICLKNVGWKIGSVGHFEVVHFQDKSKCPYGCPDLEFETEPEWIEHLEGCTSDKITEASQCSCLLCGAVFRNQFLRLSHHHKTHETFPCEICSQSFSKQTVLETHQLSHEESKPHLCSKCGKRFRQAWNLQLHLTTICGDDEEARKKLLEKRRAQFKSFRDKKKNFNCDECSKSFITSARLELHKEKVHGGEEDGGERTSGTEDSDSDS